MHYLAAIDYDHLDNGVFLSTLARSLSQHQDKNVRSVIIHGDSEYTERIIQTGVMRNQATVRSIKDLNNRLVALFADQGVSTVGINPFQRNFITLRDGNLSIDQSFLNTLPEQSVLLLSTLVYDADNDRPAVVDLSRLLIFLHKELETDELFIFSKSDEAEIFTEQKDYKPQSWKALSDNFRDQHIPDEFTQLSHRVRLITARDFNQLPNLDQSILIKSST